MLAVPESVVVLLGVVHAGVEPQSFVVHGIAVEDGFVKVVGLSGIVVGLVDGHVGGCRIAFATHQRSGQVLVGLFVINSAAQRTRGDSGEQRADHRSTSAGMLGKGNGAQRPFAMFLGFGELFQDVRRKYGAKEIGRLTHVVPPIDGFRRRERPAGH